MKLSQLRKIIKESIKELVAEGSNCWAYAGAITGNEGCRQVSLLGNGSCPGFSSYEACCRNGAVDPLANRCTDNVRGPRGITPTDALTKGGTARSTNVSNQQVMTKQPLNEEKNFFDCQTNWINANGPGIMAANQLEDGSYNLEGAFRTMMSGSIKACKHLLNVSNQQVMTKN